jgi:Skp family chaperone for outer membrane proteins
MTGAKSLGSLMVLLTFAAGIAPLQAQEAPIKIAIVDLEAVVGQSKQGQDLQARMESFQQQVQQEMTNLNLQANELRQRLADGANSLSESRLAELNKEYEDATIALRRFRDDKQREGQKMQEESLREIEDLLEPVFEKVRDEMGFDLILNNVPGVVLMAGERVDITSMMIERFNAAAAPSGEQETD